MHHENTPVRPPLICHENGTFQKRCSNRRNLKTPAVRFSVVFVGEDRCVTTLKSAARETSFSVDGDHFENGAFLKRWTHAIRVIFVTEVSSNTT